MKKVISFCDRYSLLPSGGLVLAAVSGGKDSMCLLDILYKLKDRYGYELCAIHFNHMIRGKSADRDENFVMETCRNRKIKFIAGRGDTLRYAKEHKIGTEEAGRILTILTETDGKITAKARGVASLFAEKSSLRHRIRLLPGSEHIVDIVEIPVKRHPRHVEKRYREHRRKLA